MGLRLEAGEIGRRRPYQRPTTCISVPHANKSRASSFLKLCLLGLKLNKVIRRRNLYLVAWSSLGFAHPPAIFLRRFLVIGIALHISNQALFFAQLLEASYHLLDRFAGSRFYFQHKKKTLSYLNA